MWGLLALVLAFAALLQVLNCRRELRSLSDRMDRLQRLLGHDTPPIGQVAQRLGKTEEPAEAENAPEPQVTSPSDSPMPPVESSTPALDTATVSEADAESGTANGWDWSQIEQVLGQRWLTWVGGIALFLAVGFFIKYAIDREWLGPATRVLLGVFSGLAVAGAGLWFLRKQMLALGQGLVGVGMAVLYLSFYASSSLYGLVPLSVAFSAMVVVTIAGLSVAVRHDALPLAFLAMLGGLLTPVLLSTGEDSRDVLFGYLLLLNLGALAAALFRRWRALDILVFTGTVLLYAAWFGRFYDESARVPALIWLGLFYALFLVLPFIHHFAHATPIFGERFVLALFNASFALYFAFRMLGESHEHSLGFICLAMAVCYVALARLSRKRIPSDERALLGFTALAVFLTTISVPMHLGLNGVTLVWAAQGPVLLYLGYRYEYPQLRTGALALLVLSLLRVIVMHLPLHDASFTLIFNRSFGTVAAVPVATGVFAFIHHRWQHAANDQDQTARLVCGIGAGMLALALLHYEFGQWFRLTDRVVAARAVACLLWAAGAVGFAAMGLRLHSIQYCWAGVVALGMAGLLAILLYAEPAGADRLMVLNLRFGAVLGAIFGACAMAHRLTKTPDREDEDYAKLSALLKWVVLVGLLLLLSAEPYTYWKDTVADPAKARWLALMSVSVVWAVYASVLLVVGFWRNRSALRLAGLALFGATALKLVLVDIAGVAQIYRVVAFLVLGVLMIAGAYLYHRVEQQLDAAGPEQDE